MRAFYFGGAKDPDVVAAFRREPRFDVRRTPSQMGMLTELLRRMKGVRQTLHPTHRAAALGPLAAVMTDGHDAASSTFGPGTPFDFMAKRDTLIIGLGKPFEILTQVHHAESLMGDQFPVPSEEIAIPVTIRDERGEERPFTLRVRRFARARNMWRLPELMTPGQLHSWSFHRVPLFSARAARVTADLIAAAREGRTLRPDWVLAGSARSADDKNRTGLQDRRGVGHAPARRGGPTRAKGPHGFLARYAQVAGPGAGTHPPPA